MEKQHKNGKKTLSWKWVAWKWERDSFLLVMERRRLECKSTEHKMEKMTDLKWVLKDLNLAATVI